MTERLGLTSGIHVSESRLSADMLNDLFEFSATVVIGRSPLDRPVTFCEYLGIMGSILGLGLLGLERNADMLVVRSLGPVSV